MAHLLWRCRNSDHTKGRIKVRMINIDMCFLSFQSKHLHDCVELPAEVVACINTTTAQLVPCIDWESRHPDAQKGEGVTQPFALALRVVWPSDGPSTGPNLSPTGTTGTTCAPRLADGSAAMKKPGSPLMLQHRTAARVPTTSNGATRALTSMRRTGPSK